MNGTEITRGSDRTIKALDVNTGTEMSTFIANIFSNTPGMPFFLNSTQSTDEHGVFVFSLPVTIIVLTVTVLLTIGTLAGNMMVLLAFYLERPLRHMVSNYFIFSLAVADLVVAIVSTALYPISKIIGYWPYGWTYCRVWWLCVTSALLVSQQSHLFIAFDRFLGIKHPHSVRRFRTNGKILCVIAFLWAHCVGAACAIYAWGLEDEAPDFSVERPICKLRMTLVTGSVVIPLQFFVRPIAIAILYYHVYKFATAINKVKRRLTLMYTSPILIPADTGVADFYPHQCHNSESEDENDNFTLRGHEDDNIAAAIVHVKLNTVVGNTNHTKDGTDRSACNRDADKGSRWYDRVGKKDRRECCDTNQFCCDKQDMPETEDECRKRHERHSRSHNSNTNSSIVSRYTAPKTKSKISSCGVSDCGTCIDAKSDATSGAIVINKETKVRRPPDFQSRESVLADKWLSSKRDIIPSQSSSPTPTFLSTKLEDFRVSLFTVQLSERRTQKAMRTISFILVAYIFCYGPWAIFQILVPVFKVRPSPYLSNILFYMTHLSCFLNPLMYAWANPLFKATLWRMMHCDFHRNRCANANLAKRRETQPMPSITS